MSNNDEDEDDDDIFNIFADNKATPVKVLGDTPLRIQAALSEERVYVPLNQTPVIRELTKKDKKEPEQVSVDEASVDLDEKDCNFVTFCLVKCLI